MVQHSTSKLSVRNWDDCRGGWSRVKGGCSLLRMDWARDSFRPAVDALTQLAPLSRSPPRALAEREFAAERVLSAYPRCRTLAGRRRPLYCPTANRVALLIA